MNALDSPLEALAFDYVSYGISTMVNNLWTWVAVITAAVSFWRIRAAGSTSATACSVKKPDSTSPCIIRHDLTECDQCDEPVPDALAADFVKPPAATGTPSDCYDGVTKRNWKFTLYYDGESDQAETEAKDWSEDGGSEGGSDGQWWESWERVLMTRRGEMDWYRFQDLTVINGNVVRLWDAEHKNQRGNYSPSCAVW